MNGAHILALGKKMQVKTSKSICGLGSHRQLPYLLLPQEEPQRLWQTQVTWMGHVRQCCYGVFPALTVCVSVQLSLRKSADRKEK